eukprot:gene24042-30339_t
MLAFAEECPKLTRLESDCDFDTTVLSCFIRCCPLLEHLIVHSNDFLEGISLSVFAECPNLKTLDLHIHVDNDRKGFVEFASKCTKLSTVKLQDYTISDAFVGTLARSCPELKCLNVLRNWCDSNNLTNQSFFDIAKYSHNLTSINLSGCLSVSDIAMMRLAKGCTKLIAVDVTNCPKITDAAIFEVFEHCKSVQRLVVARTLVTDICLLKGATEGVSSIVFNSVYEAWTIQRTYSHTRHSGPSISLCSKEIELTVGTLETLAHLSPQLEVLVLYGMRDLTDKDMLGLFDEDLITLVVTRPRLTSLSFKGCRELTDLSIERVAECCIGLKRLEVACARVSDKGALALIRNCLSLVEIDLLKFCDVTEWFLHEIAQRDHCCHTLREASEFINSHPMKRFECDVLHIGGRSSTNQCDYDVITQI